MIDIVNVSSMYNEFKIPKGIKVKHTRSGKVIVIQRKPRSICAPHEELKAEQRRILYEELGNVKLHESAYGFRKQCSIYDNAAQHIGACSILNIDMKDFFNTISREQVYRALVNRRFPENKAEYISYVCTRNGFLPQGAPTSPTLSNIVVKPLDKKVQKLCSSGMKYTRYADDITISADSVDKLITIKPKIAGLIESYGWKISGLKVHIVSNNNPRKPQEVTGIIVNRHLSIAKKDVRIFESVVHHIECEIKDGTLATRSQLSEKYRSLESLAGYANFLCQTNQKYRKYADRVSVIGKTLR